MAFDRSLARVQLYPTRHGGAGWALKEFHEGLKLLKDLPERMPGLSSSIRIPGVGASRAAIDAAVDQTSVVRAAVRMLARR